MVKYDLAIIGSGPGGYVAAIRANQLGLKTAVIEKSELGGVCLNWGCIPSKSLIHQATNFAGTKELEQMGLTIDKTGFDYEKVHAKSRQAAHRLSKGVQFLLKKNNIDIIEGEGKLKDKNTILVNGKDVINADNIIIATGSSPKEIPQFPLDEETILSSKGILGLTTLPKSIIIIGGGAIGVEFAYVMNSFDVEVHLVELFNTILPFSDSEIIQTITRAFKKKKINLYTSTKAISCKKDKKNVELQIDKNGKEITLKADKMLVAVGRTPNTSGLGLEELGIEIENGFIKSGEYYKTSIDNIYAIGDVISSPLLAHVASKEGEIAVEHIAGPVKEKKIDESEIPYAVYCEPQLAGFGETEESAKTNSLEYETASFPYRAVGKAVATEKIDGLVKIIFNNNTKEILGAHIAGANATELIHQLLLAKKSELLLEDIATMIHAHPTLSEAIMEGARMSEGRAIHI